MTVTVALGMLAYVIMIVAILTRAFPLKKKKSMDRAE